MEILPLEILILISKEIGPSNTARLGCTAKRLTKILKDPNLWTYFADTERDCEPEIFKSMLKYKRHRSPSFVFGLLLRCHYRTEDPRSYYIGYCNQIAFPGNNYCRDHFPPDRLKMCTLCNQRLRRDSETRYCRRCLLIPNLDQIICKYQYLGTLCGEPDSRCGRLVISGFDRCGEHLTSFETISLLRNPF